MNDMINRLRKYIEKKKMEVNSDKTKIMIIKKSKRGRKKKRGEQKWNWGEKRIEKVEGFNYLGYIMTCDNSD